MEKVRLNLDELAVQSFTTTHDHARERGTVQGNQCTCGCTLDPAVDTCWNTCADSCWDSCNCSGGSCDGTCDCGGGGGGSESFLASNCQSYGWC